MLRRHPGSFSRRDSCICSLDSLLSHRQLSFRGRAVRELRLGDQTGGLRFGCRGARSRETGLGLNTRGFSLGRREINLGLGPRRFGSGLSRLGLGDFIHTLSLSSPHPRAVNTAMAATKHPTRCFKKDCPILIL